MDQRKYDQPRAYVGDSRSISLETQHLLPQCLCSTDILRIGASWILFREEIVVQKEGLTDMRFRYDVLFIRIAGVGRWNKVIDSR